MKTSAKLAAVGTLVACACAVSLPGALAAGPTAHAAKTTTVTLKNISFNKATKYHCTIHPGMNGKIIVH